MSQGIPLALEDPKGASPSTTPNGAGRAFVAPGAAPENSGASALRAGALDFLGRYAGAWIVGLILCVLVAVPVGAFVLQTFMPRLFGQGSSWFTLAAFTQAFQASAFKALANSIWVSGAVCAIDLVVGGGLAWLVQRTTVGGRRIWPGFMWALLLVPTYLMAQGWQYLLEPHGVFAEMGVNAGFAYHIFFGPAGVVFVLALANAPFAYLTISAALGGLGSQYEEAVRVHGGGRVATARMVVPILAPAVLASVALVFAETMSDYGVSSTLAFQSHFQMATYAIYESISNLPAQFGVAGALSILLLLSAALPLALQSRVTRGRSYAILTGRTRQATRHHLRRPARAAMTVLIAAFFLLALGAPALGAFYGSFVSNLGVVIGAHDLTLNAYREVLSGSTQYGHVQVEGASGLAAPILLSTELAAITASVTAVLGLAVARLLAHRRRGRFTKAGDLLLLGSIALPGIVLGCGYIFAFNLPIASRVGLDLYETLPLLVMGYLATSVPTQSRIMMGQVAQVHTSLLEAARVSGARAMSAWRSAYIPVVSRVLVLAWLVTFTKTFFELPISQLLYPPGQEPVSVAINSWVSNYHYDIGTAMTVLALLLVSGVIALVSGGFRLLAPRGWQRVGWRNLG
jgi:iron(III) transport system permease protein